MAGRREKIACSVAATVVGTVCCVVLLRSGASPLAVGSVLVAVVLLALGTGVVIESGVRRDLARVAAALRRRDFDAIPIPDDDFAKPIFEEVLNIGIDLRKREQEVALREALLRLVVDAMPMAVVLFEGRGKIITANAAARELFFEGHAPEGKDFLALLTRAPGALRRAIAAEGDELVSLDDDAGTPQTLHLAKRHLAFSGEPVVLVMVTNVTRELGRQEVEAWKRVIRVLSHELNNSLAPMVSLAHSGKLLAAGAANEQKLLRVLDTVERRAAHLAAFLEGYARFSRLPAPKLGEVAWEPLVSRVLSLYPGARCEGALPSEPGWGDAAQLEQLLVNLLKNAGEAGSPPEEITVAIESQGARGTELRVRDRGQGMSDGALKSALVPFFSTKSEGGGLGLPICREIAAAHGGSLRLGPREGGGLEVVVRLPPRERTLAPTTLSLTRA